MESFGIFEEQGRIGIFCWDPEGIDQKEHCEVTTEDILRGLKNPTASLSKIVSPESLHFPKRFCNLPPQKCTNMFPHEMGYIVPLHMAKKMGVDLQKVDFVLGGSSLNVLALREIERQGSDDPTKYLVQKCPVADVILIVKSKVYETNYSDFGFQFERFVTGGRMEDKHDVRLFESLQLMKIGDFTVLFSAEADAVDDAGCPVEIKSGNPKWFGSKVMFQMISSGSKTLVMANKTGKDTLAGVSKLSQEQMINTHSASVRARWGENILGALTELKHSELVGTDGPVEMDFSQGGMLLKPCSDRHLLPTRKVVEELLT
mmetsp:Transcript_10507/g.23643  ORF Transcript_10507/g.23643 Transcript_10507/m.23643 type:complete len:317 (-) Transcript_10507:89-1039(-)|eukprot:CAMPEP_0170618768 /NCGR_PEP_ID=MMETSP0224-20130122/27138_1 /TAXON_ID=285029 /ORGANISM="Togula jolla, Strain CCCM 725" /LENGTH=316 /DNA_ID=CAMNT_0010944771 /DNA_START=37 /DNA_END=987 /DNA_ORIENTATION=+